MFIDIGGGYHVKIFWHTIILNFHDTEIKIREGVDMDIWLI